LANADVYFSMLFSAYGIRLLISGLTSAGVLNKINFKGVGV